MANKIAILLALLSGIFLMCGCVQQKIGGERDEHGCLVPAGYSWNNDIGACVREWELDDSQKQAAKIAVAPLSFPVTILNVDVLRCPGCFVIHLQRNDNQKEMQIKLADWKVVNEIPEEGNLSEKLTIEDAMEIAKNTECTEKGTLTEEYFYNNNSRTWWIGLDMKEEFKKSYCNPACVVSEDTKTAEINWRCTGLIIE